MIDRDVWLKASAEAESIATDDDNAITRREFEQISGLKKDAAQERLTRLVKLGKAIRVTKRTLDVLGRPARVIAYKLVEKDA